VKKCASCTKDLPDAALHCVFCGAKQPPAPSVQPGLAKTAFGYSPNELADQKRQGPGPQRVQPPFNPPPPNNPLPAFNPPQPALPYGATVMPNVPASPYGATIAPGTPPSPYGATIAQPGPFPPRQPPGPTPGPQPSAFPQRQPPGPTPGPPIAPRGAPVPPAASGPNSFVPSSAPSAPTMFVQGPQGPQGPSQGQPMMHPASQPSTPAFARPQQPPMQATLLAPPPHQPMQPQPMMQTPMPMQAPPMQNAPMLPQAPIMAIPRPQPPPYLASHTASRLGRPVEPWRDSLRQVMFLWGVLLLIVFVTPLATAPEMSFYWTLILHGEGTARLPPLLIISIGVLSAIVAPIPMQPAARGLIAALFGLAGIIVPIALVGVPPWQIVVSMAATLLLVPGLLLRSEYRDALLPRLLVTLGALAFLLLFLLPDHGTIPLVGLFKLAVDLPGARKLGPALVIAEVLVILLSLLAWLPSPTTGGAKLWAWLLILWSLIAHAAQLIVGGGVIDKIKGTPNDALVAWIAGGGAGGVALGAAYLVLFGYGLASVLGKQLE
jgi:hypothetical protein